MTAEEDFRAEEKKEWAQQEIERRAEKLPVDLVSQANEAAARLEKANAELKNLLTQQALLKAQQVLGGQSSAGKQQEPEEDKEIKAARALLAGSGYEDELFPTK